MLQRSYKYGYPLLIIQPMCQPRTYFFNHYIVLFSMNLHSPSKSNTNSTQILVFILTCLYFTTGNFHTYFAKNVAYTVDPVVDRVGQNDRLGCFVDRLHRLVDDLADFRSTWSTCGHFDHNFLLVLAHWQLTRKILCPST